MLNTLPALISEENFVSIMIKLLITIIFILSLKFFVSQIKLYRTVANMHSVSALPVIGLLHLIFMSTEELLVKLSPVVNNYKSPMKIWLGPYLYVASLKPEHLKVILNHPMALGKEKFYKLVAGSKGLICAPVALWKKERKLVAPLFNQKILNSFIQIFEKNTMGLNSLLEGKDGQNYFDVFPFIFNSTLNSLVETVFASDCVSQEDIYKYTHYLKRHYEITKLRMKHILLYFCMVYNKTKIGEEHKNSIQNIKKLTTQMIESKRNDVKKPNIEYNSEMEITDTFDQTTKKAFDIRRPQSFIDLIKANKTEDMIGERELKHISMEIINAGTETSAITIGFVLMMLGIHPDIQEKVYSEIDDMFGSSDRNVTTEDLSYLRYTEMVIKETMRLFPPVPAILREAAADIQLENEYIIPSGSGIIIPIYGVHRNPEIWPNPLKFDPERFSPDNISERNPYCYIPFSGGPRNCIGNKYAMISLKTTIATIIRKYKVHCPYKSLVDIRTHIEVVLKPVEGHLISLEKRTTDHTNSMNKSEENV